MTHPPTTAAPEAGIPRQTRGILRLALSTGEHVAIDAPFPLSASSQLELVMLLIGEIAGANVLLATPPAPPAGHVALPGGQTVAVPRA